MMEGMEIRKAPLKKDLSKSLKNENVGLKDIQDWGENMKKRQGSLKMFADIGDDHWICWMASPKLVGGATCVTTEGHWLLHTQLSYLNSRALLALSLYIFLR